MREYWIQAVRHRADAAQQRPKRTIVRNVSSYGNVLGFSGTNMRYVTITRSKWFDNGLGIVCTPHRTMRMTITVR